MCAVRVINAFIYCCVQNMVEILCYIVYAHRIYITETPKGAS